MINRGNYDCCALVKMNKKYICKTERTKYQRYTPDSFVKSLFKVNPDIEVLSVFAKTTERIEVKCKKCGHIWSPKAYSLLQGKGCPECAHIIGSKNNAGKTGLKSHKTFVDELARVDNSIVVTGEYINSHTNIKCKCYRCNYEWSAKPYSLLQGHGCPRCAKSGTSFMEQLILLAFRTALENENILSRDKSLIGMELDIVIPNLSIAIEPGNWFLHKWSLNRDEKKRLLCRDKGIRLITIYDKYPKNTEPPFSEDCYIFSDDLNIVDHSVIHNLIYVLFSECGINKQFSDDEWNRLEFLAYGNSKSITHEGFVEKLSAIKPDIEVIGLYENANRRIEVKCKKCGFSWQAIPANLLEGDGCRKCGAKIRGDKERRNQSDFENELKAFIPTIKVIGTYVSRHKPIKLQCLRCGNIWETTPGSLLRKEHRNNPENNGCPECAKKRMGTPKKRVKNIDTGEIFESAVEASQKYKIVPSSIRQCCRGKSKTANGFHWIYIDSE